MGLFDPISCKLSFYIPLENIGGGDLLVFSKAFLISIHNTFTQRTFTCSKSTVEAVEKGVKYVQS